MYIVRLKTNDGEVFVTTSNVLKQSIAISEVLQMMGNLNLEHDDIDLPIPCINGATMRLVLDWCQNHQNVSARDNLANEELEWDREFSEWERDFFETDVKTLYDLLFAAHCLNIDGLIKQTFRVLRNLRVEQHDRSDNEIDWVSEEEGQESVDR